MSKMVIPLYTCNLYILKGMPGNSKMTDLNISSLFSGSNSTFSNCYLDYMRKIKVQKMSTTTKKKKTDTLFSRISSVLPTRTLPGQFKIMKNISFFLRLVKVFLQ